MIERRTLLGAGMASILAAKSAPALILRRGLARFQGFKHINLGKWSGAPVTAAGGTGYGPYPDFYTLAQLTELVALGYDHGRFAVQPIALLEAKRLGATSTYNALVEQIRQACLLMAQAGLRINLDMHMGFILNATYVWSVGRVIGTGDTGAADYLTYRSVCVDLARMLRANFTPEQVAFDIMNEPLCSPETLWTTSIGPNLHATIRAAVPDLTLIVSGAQLGNINGLLLIDPSNFANDRNTLWSIHFYDSFLFTNCANQGAGAVPAKYARNTPWPSDGMSTASYIATANDNANADGSLTAPQKATLTGTGAGSITEAFTNYATNITYAWHVNEFARALGWLQTYGLNGTDLYVGEFGCLNDGNVNAGLEADRARWQGFVQGTCTARGHRAGSWIADYRGFVDMTLQAPGGLELPTRATIPAAIRTALGLNS